MKLKNIYKRGDTYWLNAYVSGRQIRKSLKTADAIVAQRRRDKEMAALKGNPLSEWPTDRDWPSIPTNEKASQLYRSAKTRANKKGVPFSITEKEILLLLQKSKGYCALTGLPFSLTNRNGYRVPPFSPSLDRISPSHGYTADNTRLICFAMNMALNQYGEGITSVRKSYQINSTGYDFLAVAFWIL